MQQLVCGRFLGKRIIVNRHNNTAVSLMEDDFMELWQLFDNGGEVPKWFSELLGALGYAGDQPQMLRDLVTVRNPKNMGFGRASYEITQRCNYLCEHCYLGDKSSGDVLLFEDQKKILSLIEQAGCMWLQITGGEPLILTDFADIYTFAYSLGLLPIISTNGSLLTRPSVIEVLQKYPPCRMMVSLYGATAESYEALTDVAGSFDQFLDGLGVAHKFGLRVELNIIVTRYNEAEMDAMKSMANDFGFKAHIFPSILPTLQGDSRNRRIVARCSESLEDEHQSHRGSPCYVRCSAGQTFFHVDKMGCASICKLARNPNINLLECGLSGFRGGLSGIANDLLQQPSECGSCPQRGRCETCPPMLALYQQSDGMPISICSNPKKEVRSNAER